MSLFKDLLCCFDLYITVNSPTRVTSVSSTCLDNFLITTNINNFKASVVDLHLSDHFSQFISIKVKNKCKNETKYVYRRNFNTENITRFHDFLQNESWQDVLTQNCPNTAVDKFYDIILYYFEASFPIKRLNINNKKLNKNKYMTPEIIKLRNQVNLYSDIAKIDNNYKGLSTRLNNLYRNKLQTAKQAYHDQEICNSNNRTKTMWSIIKKFKGQVQFLKIYVLKKMAMKYR